jgi:hypothetical protein
MDLKLKILFTIIILSVPILFTFYTIASATELYNIEFEKQPLTHKISVISFVVIFISSISGVLFLLLAWIWGWL